MGDDYRIAFIGEDRDVVFAALALVWRVFEEFEAPEYSAEGISEFKDFIALDAIMQRLAKKELLLWGCFDGENVIGVIAARKPCHISLLFVDKAYHRKGIARSLYNTLLDYFKTDSSHIEVTVNSSPYAVEAYRRLGFGVTDKEQTVNGIRYIPMNHVFR
jgi:Acetyltransferases